jgi:transcriptional regulator with XRE-family HTH domain
VLIQKLRLQKGWSQEQLAELSGLSVRTIQRIERGQKASAETLKSLASVFEIDFSSLQPELDMTTATPHNLSPGAHQGFDNEEALAFRQVRRVKGFYKHLALYVIVISGLATINLITRPHHLWFLYSAFGWGVGIIFHGISVFDLVPFMGADWEKRQVEKRLGRKL